MLFRGLRTRIVLNLSVLLLVAMALIALVTVATAQKQLIRSEADKGRAVLEMAAQSLASGWLKADSPSTEVREALPGLLRAAAPACAVVVGRRSGGHYRVGPTCRNDELVVAAAVEAAENGRAVTRFAGSAWGVFWRAPGEVILAVPIAGAARRMGAMAMVLELEKVYAPLRKAQKFLGVYILVNLIGLTCIGFYRISRIYLAPLHRMAQRAEAYRDDGELPFAVRKEDDELTALSDALNRMIRRTAEDKDMLRRTVRSLEAVNLDLKHAQEEVIQAEKLSTVGRLASGIAHEIGNPIGIVLGYLQLLKRSDISDSEARDYITRSEEEINRISHIIRQLLGFSRPSSGDPRVISVNDVLAEVADMLRVQPVMAGVAFDVRPDAVPDSVYAHAGQLKQILINIALNAADAIADRSDGETGGTVSLRSHIAAPPHSPDDAVAGQSGQAEMVIACTDDGIGIEESNLPYIFDPFYTTKGPRRGTGLGLYVSYMIARGMGGRMEVVSTPRKGTTVSLCLPVQPQAPLPGEHASGHAATPASGSGSTSETKTGDEQQIPQR